MTPTTIHLPRGVRIETEGVNHVSGANIHFYNPAGKMYERILANEFRKEPEKTMKRFLDAIGAGMPRRGGWDEAILRVKPNLFIVGGEKETSITLSRKEPDEFGDVKAKDEILHYVSEEWAEDPEGVIGAFLNCLKQKIES